ncbi:MAG TPA: hypothetical protein VFR67_24080, partial [Pilimelia sp.]|nr:hypothetical protein [Pilimelia sp.]
TYTPTRYDTGNRRRRVTALQTSSPTSKLSGNFQVNATIPRFGTAGVTDQATAAARDEHPGRVRRG